MSAPRKQVDWEAVELHYRAGIRSLKDIGKEYGVSDAGILKKAKAKGWTRDLAAKIKAKADAKVSAAAVSAEVSAEKAANEQALIEANAEMQYRIRMEHRQDIGRARGLFRSLLEELEVATDGEGRALIEQLVEIMTPPVEESEDGSVDVEAERKRAEKMHKMLHRLLNGPDRVDSAKKLTDMLEKLVRMEREAFGIDDGDKGANEVDEVLKRILAEAK